jgi:hypothetical protein
LIWHPPRADGTHDEHDETKNSMNFECFSSCSSCHRGIRESRQRVRSRLK